jgi:hypothetical protein
MLRQMMTSAFLISVLFIAALPLRATPSLTNNDVVTLAKAGLGEETIIAAIQAQDASFDISVRALLKLKQEGVTSNVLRAMIAAMSKKGTTASASVQGASTSVNQASDREAAPAPAPAKKSWRKSVGEAVGRAIAAAKSNVEQGTGQVGNSFGQFGSSFKNALLSGSSNGIQQSSGYGIGNSYQSAPAAYAATPQAQGYYTAASGAGQGSSQYAGYESKSGLAFTQWRDPREGAFTINVPQGWNVQGGLVRSSTVDPHAVVFAISPDRRIQIFYGDPNLVPREVPNRLTAFARIREGQMTKGAWGGPVLMARYESGAQFSRQYVGSQLCRTPQITSGGTLQDASHELNAAAVSYGRTQGAQAQAWVGETSFWCGAQTGYVRAATVLAGSATGQGLGMWFVYELDGFMAADPSQAPIARYVLNTMVGSYQTDPQWEARQAQTTRDVTGAVTRAQQQMSAVIAQNARQQAHAQSNQVDVMSGWEAKNKVMDKVMQRDSDTRLGITTATDDYTSTSHTVSNDYNYYWTRPDGTVQGTNTYTPPDYSGQWRPMSNNQ